MRDKLQRRLSRTPGGWKGLCLVTLILGHLYVLAEWVFTVTKASYLDVYSWPDKLRVLGFSGALVASLSLAGLGIAGAGRAAGRAAPLAEAVLLAGEPAACRAAGGAAGHAGG